MKLLSAHSVHISPFSVINWPKEVYCPVQLLIFSQKYPLALAACVIINRNEMGMARIKEAQLNGYLNMFR